MRTLAMLHGPTLEDIEDSFHQKNKPEPLRYASHERLSKALWRHLRHEQVKLN